jgi:hypothetical protein
MKLSSGLFHSCVANLLFFLKIDSKLFNFLTDKVITIAGEVHPIYDIYKKHTIKPCGGF